MLEAWDSDLDGEDCSDMIDALYGDSVDLSGLSSLYHCTSVGELLLRTTVYQALSFALYLHALGHQRSAQRTKHLKGRSTTKR